MEHCHSLAAATKIIFTNMIAPFLLMPWLHHPLLVPLLLPLQQGHLKNYWQLMTQSHHSYPIPSIYSTKIVIPMRAASLYSTHTSWLVIHTNQSFEPHRLHRHNLHRTDKRLLSRHGLHFSLLDPLFVPPFPPSAMMTLISLPHHQYLVHHYHLSLLISLSFDQPQSKEKGEQLVVPSTIGHFPRSEFLKLVRVTPTINPVTERKIVSTQNKFDNDLHERNYWMLRHFCNDDKKVVGHKMQ